jgi:hypothetical protein
MNAVGKTGIRIAGGLILSAALVFGQDTSRRPVMSGGGPGHGRCAERLIQALELTTAQQSALEALREETAETIRPLAEQMRALHTQVETAADGESPDACAVGGLVMQGKGIRSQIADIRKAAEARFVAGLGTDQKAKYGNFISINPGCMAVGAGFMPAPGSAWSGRAHAQ